ncbi:nitroreductase [Mycobacterium sp. G7A2]|uniref:nitroreductase n=1 Tax=Mycobacterium sp. G7A2 TaxID=3317307 RepID=UPI0035A94A57
MAELDDIINRRRSSRMFLPDKAVPADALNEALTLAMRAPSNSNVQPWRVFLAVGERRDRLAAAMVAAARAEPPKAMDCPNPMHRDLGMADAVGVGMFLQTLLLALTERGIDSCVQVSTALYPNIVREHLGIPDELRVLCGVCIGYADPNFAANHLAVPRNPLAQNVEILDD